MTLLLNYSPVLRQPTGIGVYAQEVLPALQRLPHVLIQGGSPGTASQRLRRLIWSQWTLPRLAKHHNATLIFSPAPEGYLGVQRIPQVVMAHDLRPITHPERSLQSLYFRGWVPPLLRACRLVLTNSQFTAGEIQQITGLPDHRICVIPLGCDTTRFHPAEGLESVGASPYLLHVGQAYPHKNLQRLVGVFADLHHYYPDLRLVLVGKPHHQQTPLLQQWVKELGLKHHVEFRAYVPAGELPALYRGALAFVFPSLWEGFGLPVLEAMASGTPVLTSYGSGTEEAAGEAALLVDPMDSGAIQAGLRQLLDEPSLRADLRVKGLQRAREFSWTTTGDRTAQILQECL